MRIMEQAKAADTTLEASASAELKRAMNGLDRISEKINRAWRRKSDTAIGQLKDIKQSLFPTNIPQERFENFSSFYISYGKDFFRKIKGGLDPFNFEHVLFTEE